MRRREEQSLQLKWRRPSWARDCCCRIREPSEKKEEELATQPGDSSVLLLQRDEVATTKTTVLLQLSPWLLLLKMRSPNPIPTMKLALWKNETVGGNSHVLQSAAAAGARETADPSLAAGGADAAVAWRPPYHFRTRSDQICAFWVRGEQPPPRNPMPPKSH